MFTSPFVLYTLLFITGILLQKSLSSNLSMWLGLSCLACCIGYVTHRLRKGGQFLCFAWLIFSIGGASLAIEQKQQKASTSHLQTQWKTQKVYVELELVQRLSYTKKRTRFRAYIYRISTQSQSHWTSVYIPIRLTVLHLADASVPRFYVGSRLYTHIRLRAIPWYANPGVFNWRKKLFQDEMYWLASTSEVKSLLIAHDSSNSGLSQLDRLRIRIYHWFWHVLGATESSALIQALILGERAGVSNEVRTLFSTLGIAHLLAISGLHIAIIAHIFFLLFNGVLRFIPSMHRTGSATRWALLLTVPFVWLYVGLSGASPSTIRAVWMLSFALGGTWLTRSMRTDNTLALAMWFLLLYRPSMLFQISFQLSCLAVWILVQLHSSSRVPTHRWLRYKVYFTHIVRTSFWVTLGTLPLVSSFSYELSIWAPFINVLAIPWGGYFIVATALFATGVFFLYPSGATYLLKLSQLCADWMLYMMKWAIRLPGQLSIPHFHTFESCIYWILFAGCILYQKSTLWSRRIILFAFCLWIGTYAYAYISKPSLLEIHFLDVGQGDSTWIQFPNGQRMLIDAGGHPYGPVDIGKQVLLPYFRWMRQKHIDFAVLSHPHPDHFDGFRSVNRTHSIGQFWYTGQQHGLQGYKNLLKELREKKVHLRTFPHPRTLWIGEVKLQILHPFPKKNEGDTYYWSLHANDNSLVILIQYKKIRILFTGDIEQRGEELVLERHPHLRADVLKVPHHGSRTSSTAAFLNQIRVQHAVFLLGRNNRYGFPHPAVLQRYKKRKIRVWRTDRHGRIVLRTDGTKLRFKTYLNSARTPN